MDITVKTNNQKCKVNVLQRVGECPDIVLLDVDMTFDTPQVSEPVSVKFEFPCVDTYSTLNPVIGARRNLNPNWGKMKTKSSFSTGVPVHSLISLGGKNRLTLALSDADTACEIRTGVIEENGNIDIDICFFTKLTSPMEHYKATVRLDFSDKCYEDVLRDVEKWWSDECGYKCAPVPEYARLPMYSTWYSFHQNIDTGAIVKQCRLAKAMGMESVIVDDGWQTEDLSGGYSFCGDWEVAPSKVSDMKAFSDAVHDCGMKFLLWFSVPFVGVNSKAYAKFEGKYLTLQKNSKDGSVTVGVLDPRFPEVREYLAELYEKAVKVWGCDGLKLDFIDSFKIASDTPNYADGWDTVSLNDGLNKLMTEIVSRLRAVNPDVMIEFRQSYVGPAMRKYGNMLRVVDCPLDALVNRRASADMRLVSGNTAIHSDMIMWNYDDTVESAAIQIISALFCVPQISVMIDRIPESHRKMLEFYLRFWRDNRDTLLDGKFRAKNPEVCYTLVSSETDGYRIAVNYVETVLMVDDGKKLTYVNGSGSDGLTIRFTEAWGERNITIKNCMGDVLESGVRTIGRGVMDFDVPRAGMLVVSEI